MIDTWQPATAQPTLIASTQLTQLVQLLRTHKGEISQLQIAELLPATLLNHCANWISASAEHWQQSVCHLDDQEIWLIAQFYAHAEEQLERFYAAEKNPAIYLFKWLKQQGSISGKEATQALKSLSSNRYIPFGKIEF